MRVWVRLAIVPILFLAGCSSAGDDPEAAAQEVVDAAYATFNSGDVDAWVEIRVLGSYFADDDKRDQSMAMMHTTMGAEMEGGAKYQDISCESHGDGDWPVADTGDVAGYYFTCSTVLAEGDSEVPENFEWVVADGQVVAVRSDR